MMMMTTVMVVRGYDDDDDDSDDDDDDDVSPHVGTPGFPIFVRVPMVFTGHGSDGCGALVPANLVFSSSGPTVTASPGPILNGYERQWANIRSQNLTLDHQNFWGKKFRTDYDFWCPFIRVNRDVPVHYIEILLFFSCDHGSGTMADLVIQLKPIGTTVPFFQL